MLYEKENLFRFLNSTSKICQGEFCLFAYWTIAFTFSTSSWQKCVVEEYSLISLVNSLLNSCKDLFLKYEVNLSLLYFDELLDNCLNLLLIIWYFLILSLIEKVDKSFNDLNKILSLLSSKAFATTSPLFGTSLIKSTSLEFSSSKVFISSTLAISFKTVDF